MSGRTGPRDGAVAVIGVSLRFPGAESMDELWRLLAEERCVVGDLPEARRAADETFRRPDGAGRRVRGGFLPDADCFDAAFFGITPREAAFMDPQQRFALELAWQAVEDAGYRAAALRGSRTGVFMGVANSDWTEQLEKSAAEFDAYVPTGTSAAVIANRVSYWFDLRGPSLTVDTACAASLVAVHQAVRALQSGDCEQALVGAVNLCWSGRRFAALRRNGMLSEGGLCRAFDAGADGYVRAEGGAAVLLKPLAAAVADGDAVHAVIRGSGTNHGGRTNSLTITNPEAHADLICAVYREAGVTAASVGYVETHGPGTALGDPIEAHGLKTAFGRLAEEQGERPAPGSCGLGSVKTNLGHLESAAGLAGILKVIAAMRHRTLPASLHFEQLNPLVRLEDSPFRIVDRAQPWQAAVGRDGHPLPLRAGVSSFGFGGSNAHVLLESYEPADPEGGGPPEAEGPELVPVSAKDDEGLRSVARRLLEFLGDGQDPVPDRAGSAPERRGVRFRDVAHTLRTGREEMPHRAVFLAAGTAELAAQLDAFLRGEPHPGVRAGAAGEDAALALLTGDEDAAAMFRAWIRKQKLGKLAELWVRGCALDWSLLPGGTARRAHVPVYPFRRRRYWFPEATGPTGAAVSGQGGSAASGPGPRRDVRADGLPSPADAAAVPRPDAVPDKPRGIRLVELATAAAHAPAAASAGSAARGAAEPAAVPPSTGCRPAEEAPDREALERRLARSLAEVLYLDTGVISAEQTFTDAGLDSVIAVEWIRTVNERFGTSLPTSHVYDYPTVRDLAGELARQGAGTGAPSGPVAAVRDVPPPTAGPSVPPEAPEPPVPPEPAAPGTPVAEIQTALAEMLAEALYLPVEDIAVDTAFTDAGLDSIIAVEWIRAVNTRYGTGLPVADVYEYPTVRAFAAHLAGQAGDEEPDGTGQPGDPLEEVLRLVRAGELELDQAERLLGTHAAG